VQKIIATVTSKGQVTIPVIVRRHLGISTHDKLAFIIEDNQVRLVPVGKSVAARTAGMLKSVQPALSPLQENEAFEEAMAQEVEALKGS
jgi:antitoxin PrlF